jgi:ABC-type dipeptide/oligopeptide/nickel transport system permease component
MTSQIGPVNAGQSGVRQAGPAAWPAQSAVRAVSQRTLERVVPRSALRVLKRLVASAAVILSVVTVTFLVTRVFAPDPTSLFLGASGNGFASAAAEAAAKAQVRASLGLNDPVLVQYWHFLGQLARGNLGVSYETGRPVTQDLLSRLPATAELAVYALLIGVTLGVLAGVVAAVRAGGIIDRVVRFFTIGALTMPQFWIGLMLLWVFYTKLRIAPGPIGRLPVGVTPPPTVTGFYVIDGILDGEWATAWDAARELALPVITLALGLGAPIAKVVRTSMRESLTSDYVRTATALGFGRRRIWFAYALKNGLLPVVTVLAGIIAFTFTGTILVEGIFGWPGIGNYSLQAIQDSDFPAIQGFVLYAAILYVVIYEVLNYVYSLIDPRVRA